MALTLKKCYCNFSKQNLAIRVFAKVTITLLTIYGPNVLVFSFEKTKFPEGFSGPL